MGVCSTNPHVFVPFGGALGALGRRPFVTGHAISVLLESKLGSHSWQIVKNSFPVRVGLFCILLKPCPAQLLGSRWL